MRFEWHEEDELEHGRMEDLMSDPAYEHFSSGLAVAVVLRGPCVLLQNISLKPARYKRRKRGVNDPAQYVSASNFVEGVNV